MSARPAQSPRRPSSAWVSPRGSGDPEGQKRLDFAARRHRLKQLCEAFVDPRTGIVATNDVRAVAQSVGLDLPDELFNSAYAEKYAPAGDTSPRSPRNVKFRNFHAAIDYSRLQHLDGFLKRKAQQEAADQGWAENIRETSALVTAARDVANRAQAAAEAERNRHWVSDAELVDAHAKVSGFETVQRHQHSGSLPLALAPVQ